MRILKYLFTVLLVISVVVWTILLQKTHFNRAENFEWDISDNIRSTCDAMHWSKSYLKFFAKLEDVWKKIIPKQSDMINYQCWYSSNNFNQNIQHHLESWETLFGNASSKLNQKVLTVSNMNTCINKSNSCSDMFCIPQVVLGGFPKAGTTALYNLIISHPNVAIPLQKERQFWREYVRKPIYPGFHTIAVWTYLYNFKRTTTIIGTHPSSNLFTIDGSASTVFASSNYGDKGQIDACIAPVLFSRLLPKTKFIFIVRNPADRLWSDFWYTCSKKSSKSKSGVPISFKQMKMNGPNLFHYYVLLEINKFSTCINLNSDYLGCVMAANVEIGSHSACKSVRLGLSIYYYHLIKWYNLFDKDQILLLKFEKFINNVSSTMNKVWNFLDVHEIRTSHIEYLMKTVDQNTLKSWIGKKSFSSFEMLPETRTLLNSFFHPYNLKLVTLLNNSEFLW